MDETLRRAARDQDPLELAGALRRAGKPRRAWRVLADAMREGVSGARERLDAAFPIGPSSQRPAGEEEDRTIDLRAWTLALEGDPRVEPVLREWIVRGSEATLAIRAALDLPAGLPRLLQALERMEDEVWPFSRTDLARAAAEVRLHPSEVVELAARMPAPSAGIDLLRLSAIWLLGEDGDERAVEPLQRIGAERWLEGLEAARALRKLDQAASEPRLQGRPDLAARPAWAPEGPPGRVRDGLTGCYRRGVFLEMEEERTGSGCCW